MCIGFLLQPVCVFLSFSSTVRTLPVLRFFKLWQTGLSKIQSKKAWANWKNGEATSPKLQRHQHHRGWSCTNTEAVSYSRRCGVCDVGSARKWWNKASVTPIANLLSISPDGYHYPIVLDVNNNNDNGLFMWLEKYMPRTPPCTECGQEKALPPEVHKHINCLGQIKWGGPPNVRARMLWSKSSCCRYYGILNENRKY